MASTEQPSSVVLPGHLLPSSAKAVLGAGVHRKDNSVRASLAGVFSQPSSSHRVTIESHTKTALPYVGAIVLARVTRISTRQAIVDILAVSGTDRSSTGFPITYTPCALDAEFQGLIRQQDIRATEKDQVKVAESFRPGDIVRAVVISLGDMRDYYLSTGGWSSEGNSQGAKVEGNSLGVVIATSEAGNQMVPVSWKEFRDPVTGSSEARKVAKPES